MDIVSPEKEIFTGEVDIAEKIILVILEAKAMLKSSEQSIQEIADELHFANQSFFGKYFKHHTGFSPKEYRKQ